MTINWKPALRTGDQPLYLAIARALTDDIAAGRLRPDDPLPTQRDLAEELGVSIGTVTRAYAEAEKRELIRAEGRRGTFVGRIPARESGLDVLLRTGHRLIDFGINYPAHNRDPDLGPALRELAGSADLAGLLRYPVPQGLEKHRRAGARWITGLGCPAEPDNVVIAMGGQHGIYLSLAALTRPGDEVLVEELTYPGVKSVAEQLGLTLVGVEMDDQGLLPESLDRICRTRPARVLYAIPDLHNPTSSVMPAGRRRRLIEVARKYDLTIIEDAIHRPLIPDAPPTLAALAPERVVFLASVSKTVAAGLRLGFIVAPPRLTADVVRTIQAVNLMTSPLVVEIFSLWLEDGTAEAVVAAKRDEARLRQKLLVRHLGRFDIQTHPQSYCAWLNLPPDFDQARLTLAAYRQGVMVTPAEVFSVSEDRTPNAVRICPATPDDAVAVEAGLEILAGILARQRPDVGGLI